MANRDLTSLILKCLGRAFPDSDLSKGGPVWNMVVVPISQYVDAGPLDLPIREYIKSILMTKFPGKLEMDKDGVLDDLVMKPFEALTAPFAREIYQIRQRQTIADLRMHTPESIGDLASNFGIVPSPGDYSRGSVRVYYPAPVNEQAVPETYFETGSGLRFYAVSTQRITSSQMMLNMDGDLYYFDVRLVAEKPGTGYNVDPGMIVRAPTLSRAVKVMNLSKLSGGISRDGVEDIAAEMSVYPCTRSIGTRRGTTATILALLGGAKVVEIVGMGDPEMMRDIIRGGEMYHEQAAYTSTGLPVEGTQGVGVPDGTPIHHTRWFEDSTATFVDLFGTTSGDVTGYYFVGAWFDPYDPLKGVTWLISKITRVLTNTRIEIEDPILPVNQTPLSSPKIAWMICPAKLTLSEVPGGILWPDTPDGEVVIRDNEIHVGGCTDVFLLGASVESTSTDVQALTDETLLGFGSEGRIDTTVPNQHFVYLDDIGLETTVIGPHDVTWVSRWFNYTTMESTSLRWGSISLDDLEAGQVFVNPSAVTPVPGRFRIVRLESSPTGFLRLVMDDPTDQLDPGHVGVVGSLVIKRKRGATKDACLQLLSPSPDAGFFKVLFEYEGDSTDAPLSDGRTGCAYRVLVDRALTTSGSPYPWRMSDKIDINLSSPKIMKVPGTDLLTFAGSDGVNSTGTDFKLYGVKAGDILRIFGGADSGIDYVLKRDPYGPGNMFLQLNRTLTATAMVAYAIYSPSTPVALPLVSVTKVSLLDADGGALGVDVPYGEPLGAYSSKFTNLSSGIKLTDINTVSGIRTVVGIADGAAAPFNPATTPFVLVVWHRQLSYTEDRLGPWDIPQADGGFLYPIYYEFKSGPSAPYALGTAAGWQDLCDDFNSGVLVYPGAGMTITGTPYPFLSWEEVVDSAGVLRRYLLVRPFGSAQMLLSFKAPGTGVLNFGEPIDYNPVSGNGELGYNSYLAAILGYTTNQVMSKDLYLGSSFGAVSPPLAKLQDMVDIASGPNIDDKDLILDLGSVPNVLRRVRMRGPHALSPEGKTAVRIGFPSSGIGRVYFKDPTDFEVGADITRFTTEDGMTYWPDPTMLAVIQPPYPETEKPDTGWIQFSMAGFAIFTATGINFYNQMILPGDTLEITYRDLITSQLGPWPVAIAADQILTIRQEGAPEVTVLFPVASSPYSFNDVINRINSSFGETIAVQGDSFPPGTPVVRLRWQKEIVVGGSALAPVTGLLRPIVPASTTNRAGSYGSHQIMSVSRVAFGTDSLDFRIRSAAFSLDAVDSRVQYRILRPAVQRICAQQMAPTDGPGPFLYGDIELLSWGVGNDFNIESDQKMKITGSWCRGYRLSADNQELTYSMSEVPWIQLNNYYQPPEVSDDPQNDQVILGSGVRIFYDRSPLVAESQALLGSREERDNNQSVLARHLFPHYVSFDASYTGGSLESVVKPEVEALITGRDPKEPLDVSDIIGIITQFGANHVDTPITLAVLRHAEDRSQDLLLGKDRVETSRLTGFLVGTINLTRSP